MAKSSPTQQLWTYITECLRLLYWIYFKPIIFQRFLIDIHSDLHLTSNLFEMRSEFVINPRLRSYIGKIFSLIVVIPLAIIVFVGSIYSIAITQYFNWLNSVSFMLVWGGGFWLMWMFLSEKKLFLYFFLPIIIVIVLLLYYIDGFVLNSFQLLFNVVNIALIGLFIAYFMAMFLNVRDLVLLGISLGSLLGLALGRGFASFFYALLESSLLIIGALFYFFTVFLFYLIYFIIILYFIFIGMLLLVIPSLLLISLLFFVIFVIFDIFIWFLPFVSVAVAYIFGALNFYFLLPQRQWIRLLTLLAPSKQRMKRLRYLTNWSYESIYLPFIDRWIVDAYRTNPVIARQMIQHLITSTNQQKVAAQAIVEIAVERLGHTQTVSDIVASRGELGWIPSPPPLEVGPALPKLLEISQDVRAAKNATSAYLQRELLNEPIKSLQDLTSQLAFGEYAHWATTYGAVVQKWQGILETAQETLAEEAQKVSEIPQAYVVGPALNPQRANSRFKGRKDLFREIEMIALSDQPSILLLQGGRRTGKSSTLNYLPERLPSTFVPLVVDVQGIADASTLTGLADGLASQVIKMALRSHGLTLSAPNPYLLDKDPFPALRDWMDEVEKEKEIKGKRILLCLDEFERLEEVIRETGSRAPLNFLRHVMQHRHRWVLLFSSSHKLEELAPYWSDYLINTRSLHISYLREEEARELIVKPVEDFPDIYEPETVDAIIQLTRCHPFLVQLVCQEVVERLNREQRKLATPEDVPAVVSIAIERASGYFLELWNNILNEEERAVLRGLVAGEQPSAEARSVVRRLVRKEVLEQKNGGYAFQVPLVEAFVREKVLDE